MRLIYPEESGIDLREIYIISKFIQKKMNDWQRHEKWKMPLWKLQPGFRFNSIQFNFIIHTL